MCIVMVLAVDPVATIAIFNALNVDPVLNMLVFGESILNNAVSIVLTEYLCRPVWRRDLPGMIMPLVTGWETFLQALGYFLKMFFGSAALGALTILISAIVSSLCVCARIMSILFSGIVMSHYTHHNLSPVTQTLMQQTLHMVAFMCETCVFAFLGLFSFPHMFELSFAIWLGVEVLVLVGRAVNIFPLSFLLNFFRDHKITPKKRQLIGTIIILFAILLLGSWTMPLIHIIDNEESQS
ncbi:unnamed protein product [Coregonus sp. 'balchen']|nr:unnamed protein product [Coregonus sp. 'balchen']